MAVGHHYLLNHGNALCLRLASLIYHFQCSLDPLACLQRPSPVAVLPAAALPLSIRDLRGGLPPVLCRAVCLLRAMSADERLCKMSMATPNLFLAAAREARALAATSGGRQCYGRDLHCCLVVFSMRGPCHAFRPNMFLFR